MTVPYNSYIHTVTFAGFFNLLLKWNGSVYKLLWRTMCIYILAHTIIALLYHLVFNREFKIYFEMVFDYCNIFQSYIPVSFVLGFYVSCIVGRWWEQFNTIPAPSRLALFVSAHIRGFNDRSRLIRRTIMRYACLGFVICMVTICGPVKKRFPTFKHMVKAGFLLKSEKTILENLVTQYNKYYVPFVWASTLLAQARKDNIITDDFAFHSVLEELDGLRQKCQTILNYDWINIPLVYTQVATMAVYIFFLSCLISRQHIPNYTLTGKPTNQGEMIIPIFTLLQFLFYMGWLKVAEELINPFGEDDDDFEINPLIDKNFKLSYLIVDEMHGECPSLVKDQYWDQTNVTMPYTEAAKPFYKDITPNVGFNIAELLDEHRQIMSESEPEMASRSKLQKSDVFATSPVSADDSKKSPGITSILNTALLLTPDEDEQMVDNSAKTKRSKMASRSSFQWLQDNIPAITASKKSRRSLSAEGARNSRDPRELSLFLIDSQEEVTESRSESHLSERKEQLKKRSSKKQSRQGRKRHASKMSAEEEEIENAIEKLSTHVSLKVPTEADAGKKTKKKKKKKTSKPSTELSVDDVSKLSKSKKAFRDGTDKSREDSTKEKKETKKKK